MIHGEAAEEGKHVLNCILGGDEGEEGGKGMGDEHSVRRGFAGGEEVNFVEGSKRVVIESDVDGKVDCRKGVVGGGEGRGGRGEEDVGRGRWCGEVGGMVR